MNDEVKWRNIFLKASAGLGKLFDKFHIKWQVLPDGSVACLSSLTRLDYILSKLDGKEERPWQR